MSSRRPMPPLKRRERDDEKAPYALLLSSPSRISSFSCLVGILVVLALAMLSFGRTRSLRTEEDPSELYVRQPGATKVLSDGRKIPSLGLGTWLSKRGEVREAVREAIKMGFRHFDAAWIYGNEDEVGKGIADCIQEGIIRREDIFVTSKLWNTFHEPEDVSRALNESLSKLGLEYLDLYLIHWPLAFKRNTTSQRGAKIPQSDFAKVPISKTWYLLFRGRIDIKGISSERAVCRKAMERLVQAGLVRSIGVSNFGISGLNSLLSKSSIKPAVNQVEGHPYLQQWPLLQFCRQRGIAVTAYSPLGSPGRDVKARGEPHLLSEASVIRIARNLNCTPAQVLLLWGWHRDTIVIPKSVTKKRLQENLQIFQDMVSGKKTLSRDDWLELNKLERKYRFVTGERFLRPGQTLEEFWVQS